MVDILVHSNSGAGKTMMSLALCSALALPHKRVTAWKGANLCITGTGYDTVRSMVLSMVLSCPTLVLFDTVEDYALAEVESASSSSTELGRQLCLLIEALRALHWQVGHAGMAVMAHGQCGLQTPLADQCDLNIQLGAPGPSQRSRLLCASRFVPRLPVEVHRSLLMHMLRLSCVTPGLLLVDLDAGWARSRFLMQRVVPCTGTRALRVPESTPSATWRMACSGIPTDLDHLVYQWFGANCFPQRVKRSRSCALTSIVRDAPEPHHVRWCGVRGHRSVKRRLEQLVLWPMRNLEIGCHLGLSGCKGIVIYGLPGTGKSLLARTLARTAGLNLLCAPLNQLILPSVGASEKALSSLFSTLRVHVPCLILLDEMEAMFVRRDRSGGGLRRQLLSQLLQEIDALHCTLADGVERFGEKRISTVEAANLIVVVGAATAPGLLDPALLRHGRLQHAMRLPSPPSCVRRTMLSDQLRRMPLLCAPVQVEAMAFALASSLAQLTAGLMGTELAWHCQRVVVTALRCHTSDYAEDQFHGVVNRFRVSLA